MGNNPVGRARIEREQVLAYAPHSYDQQTTSLVSRIPLPAAQQPRCVK